MHAWVRTVPDAGLLVHLTSALCPQSLLTLCPGLSPSGASISPVGTPRLTVLRSTGPARAPLCPPRGSWTLTPALLPPPQRPEQELTWSWGYRPRSALDRVKAMAPPPPLTPSTPLLHGEFGSYPARGPRFALTLTPQALHIQRLRPKPEARPRGGLVLLTEVSGCCTLRSRSPLDSAAYFCVYTYPRGRRGGRRRAARTFRADGAATYEENRAEAQRWATALTCLLRGLPLPGDGGEALGSPSALRPPRCLCGSPSVGVSVSPFLCVCLCDVSLWLRPERVIHRDGLQKENHRPRRSRVRCSCRISVCSLPLPRVLTTDESEAPGLVRAAKRRAPRPGDGIASSSGWGAGVGSKKALRERPPPRVLRWHEEVKVPWAPGGGFPLVLTASHSGVT